MEFDPSLKERVKSKSIYDSRPVIISKTANLVARDGRTYNDIVVFWGDVEFQTDDYSGIDHIEAWVHEFTEYAINQVFKRFGFPRFFRELGIYFHFEDRLVYAEIRHVLASLCTISTVMTTEGLVEVEPDELWILLKMGRRG